MESPSTDHHPAPPWNSSPPESHPAPAWNSSPEKENLPALPWKSSMRLQLAAAASPLDYVKAGAAAADRAISLGITPQGCSDSFNLNQSFPRAVRTSQQMARRLESPCLQAELSCPPVGANNSLLGLGGRAPRVMQNPTKAWAIVVKESGEILVNNSVMTALLGYADNQLREVKLWDLVVKKNKNKRQETLDQFDIDPETGDTVSYNSRVIALRMASGDAVTVSLTIKEMNDSSRCLVFVEPVERTVGHIDLDADGLITDMDPQAELIFQQKINDCLGHYVTRLIPHLDLPGSEAGSCVKQACTGKTEDDIHFPLSVIATREEEGSAVDYDLPVSPGIHVVVWVYSSLSGLITLDKHGAVLQADPTFLSVVLGHSPSHLEGKMIETILPGFYDEFDVSVCEDLGCEDLSVDSSPEEGEEMRKQVEIVCLGDEGEEMGKQVEIVCGDEPSPLEELSLNSPIRKAPQLVMKNYAEKENSNTPTSPVVFKHPNSLGVRTPIKVSMEHLTSTPANTKLSSRKGRVDVSLDRSRGSNRKLSLKHGSSRNLALDELNVSRNSGLDDSSVTLPTGCFFGLALHRTGGEISVLYQVKRILLKSEEVIYCVWISRDTDEIAGRSQAHLTLASTMASFSLCGSQADSSLGAAIRQAAQRAEDGYKADLTKQDKDINIYIEGSYSSKYRTLEQLGKGAFGCVRSGYRLSDKLLVVTKFIEKLKVFPDNWVEDEDLGELPLEAKLLSELKHSAIVRAIDVFTDNTKYVQMVMEKHGEMDLFEFIDRSPSMDEGLASLIFRQVVSGVDYLHGKRILHRDIKDENIIIDNHFNIKLVDFGSAVYFTPGEVFNTFYGTIEYCAPEVLKGNPYLGPELEMWSLGVLLYIIMFGENPFYDEADTARGELHPPHGDISQSCWDLVQAMLDTDPTHRASLWFIKEHDWVSVSVPASDYNFGDVVPCTYEELHPNTHYRPPSAPPQYMEVTGGSEVWRPQHPTPETSINSCREADLSRGQASRGSRSTFSSRGVSCDTSREQSIEEVVFKSNNSPNSSLPPVSDLNLDDTKPLDETGELDGKKSGQD